MQEGIIKIFLAITLVLVFSCAKKVAPRYILSQIPDAQALERLDHNLCTSLKLNVDGKENYSSPYYWRCRLSFAKYRLATGQLTPMQSKRNIEVSDLVGKISLKISENSESFISLETKKVDERHHNQCLSLGFTFETEDQAKIDEYFFCRKSLISEQQLVPPFGNQEYLKYPNLEYNISYVIDRRIQEAIKINQQKAAAHPTCIKFNIYSENFKRCVKAEDNSKQCYSEISRKKFQKEWEEKIHCQKQAYLRFGDNLIKKSAKEIAAENRKNNDLEFYNKSSFTSVGLDGKTFISQEEIDEIKEQKKLEKEKQKIKNTNSTDGLYSKYELTKLRYKYIQACRARSGNETDNFVLDLERECENLKNFDLLGR